MNAKPLTVAPGLMLSALLCLFLPFAQQREQPNSPAEMLTALDFMRDPVLHGFYHQSFNPSPNVFATVAVLCTIAGFVIALYPGSKNQTASSILAAIACGGLVYLPQDIDAATSGVHLWQWFTGIEYQPAFYVLLCSLTVTALSAFRFATLARVLRPRLSSIPGMTFRRVFPENE